MPAVADVKKTNPIYPYRRGIKLEAKHRSLRVSFLESSNRGPISPLSRPCRAPLTNAGRAALVFAVAFVLTSCAPKMLRFERVKISSNTFEAASAFDVDNDGAIDIVSGQYWFAGPDFKKQYKICDIQQENEYYDDFADYPLDVDGDGDLDIITGGWWGKTLRWRQNPGSRAVTWKVHDIAETGPIETIRFWDVDADGFLEAVPNAGGSVTVYKLVRDSAGRGTGRFTKHVIKASGCGHGLGFGDINGDGRGDFIVPDGWLQAPETPLHDRWTWHPEFKLGAASIPILVHDINGDGLADLIVGQAHDYGLYWMQQKRDASGRRTWAKHVIDSARSQYHDMTLADIDNDGRVELITGKRYRAHNGSDPGWADPVGVYYFEIDAGRFSRITLDYGPPSKASGVGIYFWVADITGNGFKDILAPGKEGLYLFKNLGP